MKRKILASRVFAGLAASLFLTVSALAQATVSADENLVRQFYPPQLGPSGGELYDFARADLDGTGKADYLVAVYCGNPPGVVRAWKVSGGTAAFMSEIAPETMGGHFPRLRLVDLDGDGRPEIVAAFATIGGSERTWIFKWSGSALTVFGPTVTNGRQKLVRSVLGLIDFFDIDGDGVTDIVENDRIAQVKHVWKLSSNGQYALSPGQLLYVNRFERHTSDPELFTAVFPAAPGQKFEVTVVIGDGKGAHLPVAGDLFVNGRQLFGPEDFRNVRHVLRATITGEDLNEVESTLEGVPGSAINVSIVPVP
jgi:hypothetical protein